MIIIHAKVLHWPVWWKDLNIPFTFSYGNNKFFLIYTFVWSFPAVTKGRGNFTYGFALNFSESRHALTPAPDIPIAWMEIQPTPKREPLAQSTEMCAQCPAAFLAQRTTWFLACWLRVGCSSSSKITHGWFLLTKARTLFDTLPGKIWC